MPLTNAQHDAIMRTYDSIRTANQHIQNQRYQEIVSLYPEFAEIENEIIAVSMEAAIAKIGSSHTQSLSDRSNADLSAQNNTAASQNISGEYRLKLEKLNKKRLNCLAAAEKPADYLDSIYTCPACRDTGYVNGHKCDCFNKKAIDLVYHDSNLKNIIANENFDTFSYEWYDKTVPNPANGLTPYHNMQQIVSICHSFIDNFDSEFSNLLLFGETGVGKTFLTNCIAKELLDTSHSVIYLTAIELFQKFEQYDFNKGGTDDSFDRDYILDCDLLIIDDLGTEVGNSYTNSKLFYCINERILRQKSVVISTNLSLSDLRDTYSERIFSRLASSYKILKLFGQDIRMLKRTRKK